MSGGHSNLLFTQILLLPQKDIIDSSTQLSNDSTVDPRNLTKRDNLKNFLHQKFPTISYHSIISGELC